MNDVCGIYKIENKINHKVYIGQSQNVFKRFMQHKAKLNSGKHCGKHLQYAWNLYGADNFDFVLLEECPPESLDDRETYWIMQYDSMVNGYNSTLGGGGKRGWKTPYKTVIKRMGVNSATARKVVCLNDRHIYDCIVEAAKAYGLHPAQITMCCRGIAKSAGGSSIGVATVWAYHEEYINMSNEEITQRLIDAHSVRQKEKNKIAVRCITTDEVFSSITSAARQLRISKECIRKCINGFTERAGGMKWERYIPDEGLVIKVV